MAMEKQGSPEKILFSLPESVVIREELKLSGDLGTLRTIGKLISCLLQSAREANDDAKGEDLVRGTGKIQAFKELKTFLDFDERK